MVAALSILLVSSAVYTNTITYIAGAACNPPCPRGARAANNMSRVLTFLLCGRRKNVQRIMVF